MLFQSIVEIIVDRSASEFSFSCLEYGLGARNELKWRRGLSMDLK